MGDRIEPGGPGHLRRRSFGRFQKMDDGIQRRRDKDRHIPLPGFQQSAENESAKKYLLDNEGGERSSDHFGESRPVDSARQRRKWRREQDRAAAKPGNR